MSGRLIANKRHYSNLKLQKITDNLGTRMGKKGKLNYHRKHSYLALQFFGSVYCPRCEATVDKGPSSSKDDQEFLKLHQTHDKDCKIKPNPDIELGLKRIRPDDHEDNYTEVGGVGFECGDCEGDRLMYLEDIGVVDFSFPVPIFAEDVTNTKEMPGERPFEFGQIQMEAIGEAALLQMDIYKLEASDEILRIQDENIRLFEEGEITRKFEKIRTPKGKHHVKKWEDLVDLYDLGIDCNLSRVQKNKMLATFSKIHARNEIDHYVTIPKTWDSIEDLFMCSYLEMFKEKEYEYALPEEFFGTFELPVANKKPLGKFRGLACDVKTVLAEALLEIDPSQFAMKYKRDDGILGGFESSNDFRKICEDDENFHEHPVHGRPISLCITVRTDETTCNTARTETEQPVVISILNAKGDAYKMIFLGYAPIHKPYSDEVLKSLLIEGTYSGVILNILPCTVLASCVLCFASDVLSLPSEYNRHRISRRDNQICCTFGDAQFSPRYHGPSGNFW